MVEHALKIFSMYTFHHGFTVSQYFLKWQEDKGDGAC